MHQQTSQQTVKRVLGPAEPEVLCDECFDKLDEYVQLELSGGNPSEELPGMHPHLEGCPACHEDYESLRALLGASDSPQGASQPE